MEHLNCFQVDHLLLLVGSNPLPNAVAGKLLATPCGTITLVHSGGATGTADVAQRLRTWLNRQGVVKSVELKEVEESNPTSIVQGVRERLKTVNAQRVGLNYTGGTKAMSVHAYRTVEQWAEGKDVAPVFSYLDARRLEMVFDPADPASGQSDRTVPVGRAVEMNLENLLGLHSWRLNQPPNTAPVLPESARALAQVFASDEQAAQTWRKWKCETPQPEISDLPPNEKFKPVRQALSSEIQQSGKPRDWEGWLSSKWLEHHVLDVLNGLAGSLCLHQCVQNIVPKEVEFDVDVIALRGYQLFAFSCGITEDKKEKLKLKLFEAFTRARQIGGEEARAALVCLSDEPIRVEREMINTGILEGHIRVFGRKHLANLANELAQWIQSQSGEE